MRNKILVEKDKLESLAKTMSVKDIARLYGVTSSGIRRKFKKEGISEKFNSRKSYWTNRNHLRSKGKTEKMTSQKCLYCEINFNITEAKLKVVKHKKRGLYCSKVCSGKQGRKIQLSKK